jgi:hypothetical protein
VSSLSVIQGAINPKTNTGYATASPFVNEPVNPATGKQAPLDPAYVANGYSVPGSSTVDAAAAKAAADKADTIAYLSDQANQLRGLLGRTDTNLNQGLARNEDDYNFNYGQAQQQHDSSVTDQNTQKLSTYDTINRNAGNGYRSLAQIVGRASGTGSSAFQDLLPDVVGKDTSSKRLNASNTYGQNISKIDQNLTSTAADLMRQKKANEEDIRTKVEQQRQGINDQLASNAGQIAQASGGGYAAIKAAQTPYQQAIENSRNAVDSFFNTFRTQYTAPAPIADLSQYTADRSSVNANAQGTDPNNPYAALLRKKLQGGV